MSSKVVQGARFLSLRVLLTERCNLTCVFCHNEGQEGLSGLSALKAGDLRTLLDAAGSKGLRQVKFSGGEPTLFPGLPDLVRQCVEAGYDTAVISNGVNRRVLESVAAFGGRICVNVPSADPDTYARLTGGVLDRVRVTLDVLRGMGAEVAINSYARLVPDAKHVEHMLSFGREHRLPVKFLLPCQVSAIERQRRAHREYGDLLAEFGYRRSSDTPYDSTWHGGKGQSVRMVKPWCPGACHEMAPQYRSIRLTTQLQLRPCFGNARFGETLDLDSVESCARSFDRALSSFAEACGDRAGVQVRRRQLADAYEVESHVR
ncbi:radical SAM protein [Amycolatopsis sp. SID8362]|uniref:radical SAM protein n=1 Tax=Amycolatopsis sp. SID8362 TaxID=2690346 RepID=UPI00136EF64B|nr:radical SAM protein [Amycolatopsis sp. SID8362]NBH09704.1 radical SAM protein [Amycolatopsis sp. SID8362]NED46397.1 radical SAM protein [Amycolatopsis sp. SID8362]